MERAGFRQSQWEKLLHLGTDFDFYLSPSLPPTKLYDAKWRLFHLPESSHRSVRRRNRNNNRSLQSSLRLFAPLLASQDMKVAGFFDVG
jgi:hypothetical protein